MLEGPHGTLAFRSYPARKPWLHMVISHGFSEHLCWWDHVARELQEGGVSAYLFDHYHHGRSSGRRGDVSDYNVLCEGLLHVLEQVGAREMPAPDAPSGGGTPAPLVLLGHSNGGLVALRAMKMLEERSLPVEVSALVLSSPLLGLPPLLEKMGMLLVNTVLRLVPWMHLPVASRPWRLTRDRRVWPRYYKDPLRFKTITPRFLREMVGSYTLAHNGITSLKKPLLYLTGECEKVVYPPAGRGWFEKLAAPEKNLVCYERLNHELFNEPEWRAVLEDVLTWCSRVLGCRPADVEAPPGQGPTPEKKGGKARRSARGKRS